MYMYIYIYNTIYIYIYVCRAAEGGASKACPRQCLSDGAPKRCPETVPRQKSPKAVQKAGRRSGVQDEFLST